MPTIKEFFKKNYRKNLIPKITRLIKSSYLLTDNQFIIINTSLKYRAFLGWLLAILVANAVLLQDLHRLVAHQHDPTPHCEAGDSDTHIHGEEFLVKSCIVCCFQFSPSEQTEVVLPIIAAPFVVQNISPFAYLSLPKSVILTSAPRGPPTRFV